MYRDIVDQLQWESAELFHPVSIHIWKKKIVYNPSSYNKNLALSIFEVFADDNFNVTKAVPYFLDRIENIMRKGEKCCLPSFSPFSILAPLTEGSELFHGVVSVVRPFVRVCVVNVFFKNLSSETIDWIFTKFNRNVP